MKLLLVHGRSQEDKNPAVLRTKWETALYDGAEAVGLDVPITEDDIVFPYFGDALLDLTASEHPEHHRHEGEVAPITRANEHYDDPEFRCRVLNECLDAAGVDYDRIWERAAPEVRKAGPLSREWVQVGLALLDRFVPSVSAFSLNLAAEDVAMYLENPTIQAFIETGIARAVEDIDPNEEFVVVGHSLGSIIAYRILAEGGVMASRPVRLFLTLGSPLGITAVRTALHPIAHPPNVESWFNAYDDRDAVALHPLDETFFPITPAIENYGGVENNTKNRHGIAGYLTDEVIATRLINALSAGE